MGAEAPQSKPMVLVVEDDPQIAETVGLYLHHAELDWTHFTSAEQANVWLLNQSVDLVLLDLMLLGNDGFWLLAQIKSRTNTPVIMLTAKSTEEDIIKGLESGAVDYITKPFKPREMVARVQAHLRLHAQQKSGQTTGHQHGKIRLSEMQMQAWRGDQLLPLTRTEFDLLLVMMRHTGRVITRQQLLDQVFGHLFEGNERSIDTHIYNLRQKLEPTPQRPEYIHTIHGVGFRFERLKGRAGQAGDE